MKKIKKRIFGSVFVLVLLISSSLIAFAGVGNRSFATENDVEYYFYASTYGNQYLVWGGATVGTVDKRNVEGGWMGVKPKLYNIDGTLEETTDWDFSTTACAEMYCRAGETSKSGTYYAVGNIKLYNSKGSYTVYNTMRSPYVTLNAKLSDIKITKNDNGEIYGSEYFLNQAGIQPDLIAAIGDNGIYGFVKDYDLNHDADSGSPEEAINMTHSDYKIPLYDEDGITVVDTFTIKAGIVESKVN